jgi:hypothetical protein
MNHLKDSEETRNKIHYAYILVKEYLTYKKGLKELKAGLNKYIYDLDKRKCLNIRYYSEALKNEFKRELSFKECERAKCKKTVPDITEEHMICRSVLRDEFIKRIEDEGATEKECFDFLNKHLMICTMKKEEEKKLKRNRPGLEEWKEYYEKAGINPHPAINNK